MLIEKCKMGAGEDGVREYGGMNSNKKTHNEKEKCKMTKNWAKNSSNALSSPLANTWFVLGLVSCEIGVLSLYPCSLPEPPLPPPPRCPLCPGPL